MKRNFRVLASLITHSFHNFSVVTLLDLEII